MKDYQRVKLTPLERKCRRLFTQRERIGDIGDRHRAVLKVAHQYFDLNPFNPICDTKREVEWMRDMLAKALAQIPTILLRRKPKTKCKTSN